MKWKKFTAHVLICLILAIVATVSVFAHGGKTDEQGGHYDSDTGSYHYHHGYPAHQHTFGRCPYGYDDKTDHSPGDSKNSVNTETTTAETDTDEVTTKTSKNQFERNGSRPRTVQTTTEAETKGNFFTDWNVSLGDVVLKVLTIIVLLAICAWISLFISYFIAALIIDGINSIKKRRYPPKRLTERTEKVIIVIAFVVCFSLGVFFSYLYFK